MIKRKCLWDESHLFDVRDEKDYRRICPSCYYNVYKAHYEHIYPPNYFTRNIKKIKIQHHINEIIAKNPEFKNKLKPLINTPKKVSKICFICDKDYEVFEDEADWRYLCDECFIKYTVPLKEKLTPSEIKDLHTKLKEEKGSTLMQTCDVLEFANIISKNNYHQ